MKKNRRNKGSSYAIVKDDFWKDIDKNDTGTFRTLIKLSNYFYINEKESLDTKYSVETSDDYCTLLLCDIPQECYLKDIISLCNCPEIKKSSTSIIPLLVSSYQDSNYLSFKIPKYGKIVTDIFYDLDAIWNRGKKLSNFMFRKESIVNFEILSNDEIESVALKILNILRFSDLFYNKDIQCHICENQIENNIFMHILKFENTLDLNLIHKIYEKFENEIKEIKINVNLPSVIIVFHTKTQKKINRGYLDINSEQNSNNTISRKRFRPDEFTTNETFSLNKKLKVYHVPSSSSVNKK